MRLVLIVVAAVAAVSLATAPRSALGAEDTFQRNVVVSGLSGPVDVVSTRSEPRRLYVVEQRGTIRVLDRRKLRKGFFLDVRKLVEFGGEQGLLGLAFDPKYGTNRFIYVDYTDTNGDTRVVRYTSNGTRVLAATARILLRIDQPYANHNGGDLVFGHLQRVSLCIE
jgi:glucose/arabinose dehydrogenase